MRFSPTVLGSVEMPAAVATTPLTTVASALALASLLEVS
jgi:hypothetical protein